MKELVYSAADERATERLGAALAQSLPAPAAVALIGPLGAGKTRLVQAIAAAWRIPREDVTSPTFVLCREHHGVRDMFHLDAYRIRDDDEFLELGVDEMLSAPAATFIEWADRVADCLPSERLEVRIAWEGDTARRFLVQAHGKKYEQALDRAAEKLSLDNSDG